MRTSRSNKKLRYHEFNIYECISFESHINNCLIKSTPQGTFYDRLMFLLDRHTFVTEDLKLNSEVIFWPGKMPNIFEVSDKVAPLLLLSVEHNAVVCLFLKNSLGTPVAVISQTCKIAVEKGKGKLVEKKAELVEEFKSLESKAEALCSYSELDKMEEVKKHLKPFIFAFFPFISASICLAQHIPKNTPT